MVQTLTIERGNESGFTIRARNESSIMSHFGPNNDKAGHSQLYGFEFESKLVVGLVKTKSKAEFLRVKDMLAKQNSSDDPYTC